MDNCVPLCASYAFAVTIGAAASGFRTNPEAVGGVCAMLAAINLVLILKKGELKLIFMVVFLLGLGCGAVGGHLEMMTLVGGGLPPASVPRRLCEGLKRVIDGIPFPDSGTGPLVKALLTADRSSLEPSVVQAFRGSGASHILALSGMHLGIIYGIFSKVLSPLGNSPRARRTKSCSIVLLSGFFTIITGACPSLVRAWLFITLREIAAMLHRPVSGITILCSALTIQLATAPWNILKPGFQMSYMAMLGIFLLYPRIRALYPSGGFSLMGKLWDVLSLSIACQVFTAPLAWLHFRTFPQYFMITNMVAMPLTTALMALSVAVTLLSCIGLCPLFLVKLCSHSCTLLTESLTAISQL